MKNICSSQFRFYTSLSLIFILNTFKILSQDFGATNLPLSLNNSAPLNATCASGLSESYVVKFTVSGVGVLNSNKKLVQIDLQLQSITSSNVYCRFSGALYLKAPNGHCIKIANKLGNSGTIAQANKIVDYSFRSSNPCLVSEPDYEPTSSFEIRKNLDGNYGIFASVDNIESSFEGINADGEWKLYYSKIHTQNWALPKIIGASLKFGAPLPVSAPDVNLGKTCDQAALFTGYPLCLTTDGKQHNSNVPSGTISGCSGWYDASDNNLWIAFTPTSSNVCLNISGIRKVGGGTNVYNVFEIQSIIVKPTNVNTPCDNSWTVVNCPRDQIYGGTKGSLFSHNHCFTASVGSTYYLIIDGSYGAITEVYLTGIQGLPVILSAELIEFSYDCSDGLGNLKWQTATEKNNDYFVIEYSKDGFDWYELGRKAASGNSKNIREYEYTLTQRFTDGYFRLKQVDYDGTETLLRTIVATNCGQSKLSLEVVPNPSNGQFYLLEAKKYQSVQVVDMLGKEIYFNDQINDQSTLSIELSNAKKGTYLLSVVDVQGEKYVERLVID